MANCRRLVLWYGHLTLSFTHQFRCGKVSPSLGIAPVSPGHTSFPVCSLANNLRPGISSALCRIPRAPPVSHTSSFSLVFHQVAADFQVFRAFQHSSARGCQSRCPQGGDGGGCQQSGDLPGICSPALLSRDRL